MVVDRIGNYRDSARCRSTWGNTRYLRGQLAIDKGSLIMVVSVILPL